MQKLKIINEYFNIEDTLTCGQVFRFKPYKDGYLIISADKACYAKQVDNGVELEFNDNDRDYFYNYFDLDRDYSSIFNHANSDSVEVVKTSARLGKGIRILNQDKVEMVFSFIVSQNNNIPRIKGILEKLCLALGEKKTFLDTEYYTFPTVEKMAKMNVEFYKSIGLGYRAEYIYNLAVSDTFSKDFQSFNNLSTKELIDNLLKIKGVGRKVADCISLFGFHREDCFPVDTWIEKVYREDFKGELTDRNKITEFFISRYGKNSGYIQQYLFYYKRSLEKLKK